MRKDKGIPRTDLTNKQFNQLTVLRRGEDYVSPQGKRFIRWECKCSCGNTVLATTHDILSGHTSRCKPCGMRSLAKHNMANTRLYNVYKEIKRRCYTTSNHNYLRYGARGIKMCDEWRNDFMPFYKWAISQGYDENAPRGVYTVDRIDVNGNYCPENCRLATDLEQHNNTRTNTWVTYRGETHTLAQWARIFNLPPSVLYGRRQANWSMERIESTPYTPRKAKHQC